MPIDTSEYRRILGHWVSGVAVIAARTGDGRLCGLTANAVTSLSLRPPLVLACIDHTADSHDCIRDAGVFSVNILAADQERLARRFAAWDIDTKFEGVAHSPGATGAPLLDDALAWIECTLYDSMIAGDHTIFIGEVVDGDSREGTPLLYYRGGYGRFVP
ncbi:MAG: flavin reductase family protein [Longimicrobiales bacterium]